MEPDAAPEVPQVAPLRERAMSRNALIALIVVVLAVGGYFIWRDQHTEKTNINLPGNNQITIEHQK